MTIVRSAEGAAIPPKSLIDAIGKLAEEQAREGIFVGMGGLLPTAAGALVRLTNGKVRVIDGPFTEAKEVVRGYAIHDVKNKQEAIYWTERFLDLHTTHWPEWNGEVEVRQMFGPDDSFPVES
jgi:hypothetical protein